MSDATIWMIEKFEDQTEGLRMTSAVRSMAIDSAVAVVVKRMIRCHAILFLAACARQQLHPRHG